MKKVIYPNDSNVILTIPNHKFSDDLARRGYNEILLRKIHTYLFKKEIIDKNKNIIDLGAWIGDNTLPWSKIINGIVYAIDPSEENCNFIKEVKNVNKIENVEIIQKAITETNKIISTNGDINHCTFTHDSFGNLKIESTSLDNLYHENKITNIGYIHLDVEGMEYWVIKGASDIITKYRPVLTFEVHLEIDKYIEEMKNIFINEKYYVYMINEILLGNRSDCRNFLVIPAEKVHKFINEDENVDMNQKFSEKFVKKIENDFNNYKYGIFSHRMGRVFYSFYRNKYEALFVFDNLNNGPYATILCEYKDNRTEILKEYGSKYYVEECNKESQKYLNYAYKDILI